MSNKQMTASTSVRIRMDDVKVFGPGIAELLERIDRCESIRTATMQMSVEDMLTRLSRQRTVVEVHQGV